MSKTIIETVNARIDELITARDAEIAAAEQAVAEAKAALEVLKVEDAKAAAMPEGKEQAFYYKDAVKTAMDALRAPIDALEMIVDKEAWPIPTYADLMFEV